MMPNYVYKCPECGNKFEAIRSIEDRHNVRCNKCAAVAKLIISFNGSIVMDSKFHFFADDGALISDEKRTDRDPRPTHAGGYERRL